ncbi:MAG: DoxX family protein, partial [Muribaculaceae bacterium]|nr:DoxX family protein [Muribaculaceae bacterium]
MANNRIICAATWTARLLVGCVFVFSGFVKAIDPFASIYKAEAYLSALSLEIWPNLILLGVFSLCAIEFLVGVFILFGCFRKSIIIIVALIMAFMLPITLWLALDNPIDDCGCFGDAIKISNWTSFWKNIILCA